MAGKTTGKSSKNFIKREIQSAKIKLIAENKLNMSLLRRHLGLEPDDRNPDTFTGNEDYIKTLTKKLAKAKAERARAGK